MHHVVMGVGDDCLPRSQVFGAKQWRCVLRRAVQEKERHITKCSAGQVDSIALCVSPLPNRKVGLSWRVM